MFDRDLLRVPLLNPYYIFSISVVIRAATTEKRTGGGFTLILNAFASDAVIIETVLSHCVEIIEISSVENGRIFHF